MDGYSFRAFTAADEEAVYKLVNSAYEIELGDTGIAFKSQNRLTSHHDLADLAAKATVMLMVRKEDEAIVGAVAYSVKEAVSTPRGTKLNEEAPRPIIGHFGPFAVDPTLQKKGLGTILLRETESQLRKLGAVGVEIDLINYRTDLTQFYMSRGFKPTRVEEFHAAAFATRPSFTIIMWKSFADE
eukprot:CAMPEP_0113877458 /NCGR_PEP_ID=MMETSP0780_2-20120614/6106_1 /TAXON_ID=652834 /ORGANISM="Palpitomonas bilix" /LENGTH=184 /DNA_ID=CAMNT_0000863755 /DNA_START=145 /DNA_END=699 /DNA_ORIENTATION=- /assembly_acc=CAM_ASM_000599